MPVAGILAEQVEQGMGAVSAAHRDIFRIISPDRSTGSDVERSSTPCVIDFMSAPYGWLSREIRVTVTSW